MLFILFIIAKTFEEIVMILDKSEIEIDALSTCEGSKLFGAMSRLKIGQSFVLERCDFDCIRSVRAKMHYLSNKLGIKIKTKKLNSNSEDIRVWRIA